MKTTVEIPDELYRQAKVRAAQESRKMKDLVRDGLLLVLGLSKEGASSPSRRMAKPPVKKSREGILALSGGQKADILELAEVWGVSPEEALGRVARTARDANASREKALAAMHNVRRHPPYPAGKVQAMIDEANRLRKESWE